MSTWKSEPRCGPRQKNLGRKPSEFPCSLRREEGDKHGELGRAQSLRTFVQHPSFGNETGFLKANICKNNF